VPEKEYLLIGKIVGAHGIKGTCKICSYAEASSIFESVEAILVKNPQGLKQNYRIRWVKPHGKKILMTFRKIDDRSSAEMLIGSELYIEKTKLPDLDDDSYYWFDLIGLSVYTNEAEYLGRVISILPTGSNDVYIVKNNDREILVPALERVVTEINLDRKTMCVDLPEGLR